MIPLEIINLIKDVIHMRIDQKTTHTKETELEQIVDRGIKELQEKVKIKLSDDLKTIVEAYFEEAG